MSKSAARAASTSPSPSKANPTASAPSHDTAPARAAQPRIAQAIPAIHPLWTAPLFGLAQGIQAKLAISQPGDADEREADAVAEQAMQPAPAQPHIQRCACGGQIGPDGECAACKAQRRTATPAASIPSGAPPSVAAALRSPGQPLSAAVRSHLEPRMGADFSQVRVHTGTEAAQSARDLGALAYTVGHQIVFAPGQFQPDSHAGRRLLAHELAHVIQQGAAHSRLVVRRATPRIQRAMGTLCYNPGHAFAPNPLLASAFGIIAHKLIAADYLARMGAGASDVYFDDSFAGPIDPKFSRFIKRKNPGMGRFARAFIATTLKRPDMLIHDATRQEYEEVKPASLSGVTSGIRDLTIIDFYMNLIALPYVYGTSYTPSSHIPIGSTSVGGVPVEFSLGVWRYRSGLIVYQLCIRTDWLKVTLFAAVAALIALIIAFFPELSPILVPALAANDPEASPAQERSAIAQGDAAASPVAQAKLEVSQPGDPDEREADAVAERVMRSPDPQVESGAARDDAGEQAASPGSADDSETPIADISPDGAAEDGGGAQTRLPSAAAGPANESRPGGITLATDMATAPIQAKLAISQPGDADEREAEAVAEQATQAAPAQPHIQRCACGGQIGPDGECATCKARRAARATASAAAAQATVAAALRSPGQPLSAAVRSHLEPRMGADFSQVRVHTGTEAAQSARDLGALAYTVGHQIIFAPGQFQPGSPTGRRLLAHELAHVIQQGRAGVPRPPIQRQSVGGAAPATADEATPNRAIRMQVARERNVFWWNRLELASLQIIRTYNPTEQPIAYANRTLELQRLLRSRRLDQRTIHSRLDPDGIFGPRTFLVLRQIAQHQDEYAADIPAIQGAGFDIAWATSNPRGTALATVNALADVLRPRIIAQWPTRASSEAVLRFYRSNFYMIQRDRETIDRLLFPTGTPEGITREDRLEILSRVYGGTSLSGTAAILRVERAFLHPFDEQRTYESAQRKPAHAAYFRFRAILSEAVDDMTSTLGIQLPQNQTGREVQAQLATQQVLTPGHVYAGLVALYYLPALDETRRAEAVAAVLAARAAREQAIQENNQTAARQRADRLVALMDGPHDRLTWAFSVESVLREFLGQAHFFELVLDDLATRTGDDVSRLFTQVGESNHFTTIALLVRLALDTRYRSDARVQAAIRQLNTMRQSHQEHRYVIGQTPAVLLDGTDQLAVGQVAGDVRGAYLRDESVERLKAARQAELSQEMSRQSILQAGRIASGEDTATYTQEELARKITGDAVRAIGGIREEDRETIDYEESVRLLGVRQITVDGVEKYEVEYVTVYRENGGQWNEIADSRGWHSDSDFEYRLFMYRFSQNADVIQTTALIVSFGAVALLAWELGALAFLIELGGGPIAVGASISISALIYMVTHDHWTVEGFIVAGIQGYLAAVGFRLIAPVGGAVGRWILPATLAEASFLRLASAWLLSRAAVGGLTGLVGGPAALFVEDLARILMHGGGLSSLRAYLGSAALGFVLGIGFELAGSLLLAPIFRAGGRTSLQTIEAVVLQLREHRITPTQWLAESTGALSRLRGFLFANLDADIAQQIQRVIAEKILQVSNNYVTGVRVTIFRQIFELAEIELSRGAVAGLERMLAANAGRLTNDALVNLLRAAARSPGRANAFLSVLGASDNALIEQIITNNQLRILSEAETLLGLGSTRPPAEISALLRRFSASAEQAELFAQRLGRLREELRGPLLDALRDRGTAVSPATLLRMAESGTPLSSEMLNTLERLVRGTRSLPELEAALGAMSDPQVAAFLAMARTMGDAELAAFLEFNAMLGGRGFAQFVDELGLPIMRRLLSEIPDVGMLVTAFGGDDLRALIAAIEIDRLKRLLTNSSAAELQIFAQPQFLGLAALRSLGTDLNGAEVRALVGTYGPDTVRWAAEGLVGRQASLLLAQLSTPVPAGLRTITSSQARLLLSDYRPALLNQLAPSVSGQHLWEFRMAVGAESARRQALFRQGRGELDYLTRYGQALQAAGGPPRALTATSVTVDTQFIEYVHYARDKIARGQIPTQPEQTALNYYNQLVATHGPNLDLRVANQTIAEVGEHSVRRGVSFNQAPGRSALAIPPGARETQAYADLVAILERNAVGGGDAAAAAGDRSAVADAFFAVSQRGTPNDFVTFDRGIVNGLARIANINPQVAQANPFTVAITVQGRSFSLRVSFLR
ncbi:DUF4157 domain-containing protein [Chloroflexia bacterium SDU3-3]|nr:DUF4157 domain-containing protein [Chloroflexia bacterium SDU3-3]